LTTFCFYNQGKDTLILSIGATKGSFKGQASMRAYILEVHGISIPKKVLLNGKEISATADEAGSYSWDNAKSILNIFVPLSDVRKKALVKII
jgi:hypothetical protein